MRQMSEVVELDECRDEISGGRYPPSSRAGKSNSGGGGGMDDDVLKRLGVVESTVSDTRSQVSAIAAILPHLATKDDVRAETSALRIEISAVRVEVEAVRTQVAGIAAVMPHVATKADNRAMELRLVQWIIGIIIAAAGLAFTIGRYGH